MSQPLFHIAFPLYSGMTQLDFTGPYQFLSRLNDSQVIVASRDGGEVTADGLTFARTVPLADVAGCDLICVPGGLAALDMALDAPFIGEIRRLANGARYVTSVCTGSLILGAAGLLKGKRATCHWAFRELLHLFGAIPDGGRVVRDGNIITGGGVTAGIDFALSVLAEIAGTEVAQTAQLGLEYAPEPPFDAGRPDSKGVPPALLASYREKMAPFLAASAAKAREAAADLASL